MKVNQTIILFCFFIYFLFFSFILCRITDFDYPIKKRLNNGNYLVMTSQGIHLYNENFTSKIDKVIFDSRLIENNDYAYSENIAQFLSNDDGYIICLIRNETFILSKRADLLAHETLDYIYYRVAYQIVPYNHYDHYYYYAIIFIKSNHIIIKNYIFDSYENTIRLEGNYTYYRGEYIFDLSLSCELMTYSSNKVILCFYGQYSQSYYTVFNISGFQPIDERNAKIQLNNYSGGQLYASSVYPVNREKAVCCTTQNNNLACFGYNINLNKFTEINTLTENDCKFEPIQIKVEYFPETEEFLVGCKAKTQDDKNGPFNYYLGAFTTDFQFKEYGKIENLIPSECKEVNVFNIIYSSTFSKYSIVTDSPDCLDQKVYYCENIESPKKNEFPSDEPSISICEDFHTFDYSECYTTIPQGYFLNDTSQKIIYKCHENCQTCKKGPTETNNNCLTCPTSGTKYLDLGNCVYSCPKGTFEDHENNNIIRCKCSSNTNCLFCTEESLANNNKCIICNTNYYPKQDDTSTTNSYINCYKDPDGYYLDSNFYKPCFSSCKKCNGNGDEDDHNCSECYSNYILLRDFNKKNCYQKCEFFYYFDKNNNYHCTEGEACPDNYKLISSNKKCIDECYNDDNYIYEYNNNCVEICPSETYYNYNRTLCLNKVPKGYFCNSTQAKTIDKCHENCETCNKGPSNSNNNCLTCPQLGNKFLDLGNCVSSCSKGTFEDPNNSNIIRCKCSFNDKCLFCTEESIENNNLCLSCNKENGYYPKKDEETTTNGFINCYNDSILSEGYYFNSSNQQYEPCYSSCKKCSEIGDDINHKCDECKANYEN